MYFYDNVGKKSFLEVAALALSSAEEQPLIVICKAADKSDLFNKVGYILLSKSTNSFFFRISPNYRYLLAEIKAGMTTYDYKTDPELYHGCPELNSYLDPSEEIYISLDAQKRKILGTTRSWHTVLYHGTNVPPDRIFLQGLLPAISKKESLLGYNFAMPFVGANSVSLSMAVESAAIFPLKNCDDTYIYIITDQYGELSLVDLFLESFLTNFVATVESLSIISSATNISYPLEVTSDARIPSCNIAGCMCITREMIEYKGRSCPKSFSVKNYVSNPQYPGRNQNTMLRRLEAKITIAINMCATEGVRFFTNHPVNVCARTEGLPVDEAIKASFLRDYYDKGDDEMQNDRMAVKDAFSVARSKHTFFGAAPDDLKYMRWEHVLFNNPLERYEGSDQKRLGL